MNTYIKLNNFLTEYTERNTDNQYRPVAVGRYGIRTRESIYSKELAKDYSKNKVIFKNTLTVGMGSVQIDIGILTDDIKYSVSPAYHTYKINGINPDYLRYCLECRNLDMFERYVKRGSRQGKTIDLNRWLTYEIPVYNESEQTEIVAKLDYVEELISTRCEQLENLDQLVKSRFIEMFGAVDCRISTFGNEFNFISRGKSPSYVECSNLAVINQACIYWDTINYGKVKFNDNTYCGDRVLQYGDILINSTGTGTLGRANIFNNTDNLQRYMADSHVTIVRGSATCNPVYIKCFLEQTKTQEDIYRLCVSGSTNQIELSKEKFRQLKLPVPSLELQNEFAEFVEQTDKLKFEVKEALEQLEILKKSLMQEYFG